MKLSSLKLTLKSHSPKDTQKIGDHLANILKKGDVVLLLGGLGSGKTTLVQGVARALGIRDEALSPTFILAQTLSGKHSLHHLDFYRLKKTEILSTGIQDYLLGQGEIKPGLVFIEWADRCPDIWPAERLEIKIKLGKKKTDRVFNLTARGARMCQLIRTWGNPS